LALAANAGVTAAAAVTPAAPAQALRSPRPGPACSKMSFSRGLELLGDDRHHPLSKNDLKPRGLPA
jgi:hypothetical protein